MDKNMKVAAELTKLAKDLTASELRQYAELIFEKILKADKVLTNLRNVNFDIDEPTPPDAKEMLIQRKQFRHINSDILDDLDYLEDNYDDEIVDDFVRQADRVIGSFAKRIDFAPSRPSHSSIAKLKQLIRKMR